MHFIGTMLFKVSLLRDYLRFIVIERFNLGRFVAQLHFSRTRTPLFFFLQIPKHDNLFKYKYKNKWFIGIYAYLNLCQF